MATNTNQASAQPMRGRARMMKVLNVPMRAVLGLPIPTPLGKNLMLLSYTGRKTGKAYRVPVSYARDGEVLVSPGGGRWTLNFRDGRPVRLRLRGRDLTVRPELVTDAAEVERLIDVIARENPRAANFIPLPRRPDGRLEPAPLAAAIEHGFGIVRWRVSPTG
jgi:deazaflavin-dependent oxidoreductase (nitroreductase family)